MKARTFFIGILIIAVSSLIFLISPEALYLILPSLLFAGVAGGLYVGYMRKRPIISCFYDGLIVGIPGSLIQAAISMPILWYYHSVFSQQNALTMLFLMLLSSFMLCGVVGVPSGAALSGIYYRYLKRDRGEMELYETLLEEKTNKKSRIDKLME
ncbi:MAG: hypothetical protein E3J70_08055 [Candidatus Heimdallarchaeota archaeon]|nr:MAG: hypothetical protein E3J70_08055 [Candidatus Heimdallarchaeota archaeon]